jgi:hypothetical protein
MQLNSKYTNKQNANSLENTARLNSIQDLKLPREQLTLITTTRSLQKAKKTNRVPK